MYLGNFDWFFIGVFTILFLYFFTHFVMRRGEKYNLYFATGCLISLIRTLTANAYDIENLTQYYFIIKRLDYFSFMWGPVFYIFLADSLFPRISHKLITRIIIGANILLSIFVIATPIEVFSSYYIYDFLIVSAMLYATYIFTAALISKKDFAIPLFIANLFFVAGIAYDVMYALNIINSPFGEIHPYSYFVYLYISSVVIAKKFFLIDKKAVESQVNFLHAQIQPHFLYNTINTIIACSKIDPDKARHLLVELSTYLRGKFKNQKEMYTLLKDEISLIKSYLAIEQVRFEGRLQVEYDIDEECNILIPCLILQPIVENAVAHGLIPKKKGGKLWISVKREKDNLVARIKDNGMGMDIKRLPDILERNNRENGIGLSNTNERLLRHYNTQIQANSKIDEGTEFIVTIPFKRKKK